MGVAPGPDCLLFRLLCRYPRHTLSTSLLPSSLQPSDRFTLTPPRGWIKILSNTLLIGFAYSLLFSPTLSFSHSLPFHAHFYLHSSPHLHTNRLAHLPSAENRCSLNDTRWSRWGLTLVALPSLLAVDTAKCGVVVFKTLPGYYLDVPE